MRVGRNDQRNLPLDEDTKPRTESDLKDIKVDLTENKEYSKTDAEEIVSLIRDEDLKVVYLESDFTNPYEFIQCRYKGKTFTEIVFNRKHPAFDDIFGTVTTDDEELSELTKEEVIQRFYTCRKCRKDHFLGLGHGLKENLESIVPPCCRKSDLIGVRLRRLSWILMTRFTL